MSHISLTSFANTSHLAFVITASIDGIIKFWKKKHGDIEFVKSFKAHLEPLTGLSTSPSGHLVASISSDKYLKIFDVEGFDMINVVPLGYKPSAVCFIGDTTSTAIAIAEEGMSLI